MVYRVFLSHSTRDQGLVIAVSRLFAEYGLDVFVAEWSLAPGQPLSEKVIRGIKRSDCVVALLTRHGVRSNWVQQEIGCALRSAKPLVPLVEKGTDARDLGALAGREYIEYDPLFPRDALSRTAAYVKNLRFRKEAREKGALVAGSLLAFLLLLSAKKS